MLKSSSALPIMRSRLSLSRVVGVTSVLAQLVIEEESVGRGGVHDTVVGSEPAADVADVDGRVEPRALRIPTDRPQARERRVRDEDAEAVDGRAQHAEDRQRA